MAAVKRIRFYTVKDDRFLRATPDHLAIAGSRAAARTFAVLVHEIEGAMLRGRPATTVLEMSIPEIQRKQGPIDEQSRDTIMQSMALLARRGVVVFDDERKGRDNRYRFRLDQERVGKLVEKPELNLGSEVGKSTTRSSLGVGKQDTGSRKSDCLPYREFQKVGKTNQRDATVGSHPGEQNAKQENAVRQSALYQEVRSRTRYCVIENDGAPDSAYLRITEALLPLPASERNTLLERLFEFSCRIGPKGQEIDGIKRTFTADSWGYVVRTVENWVRNVGKGKRTSQEMHAGTSQTDASRPKDPERNRETSQSRDRMASAAVEVPRVLVDRERQVADDTLARRTGGGMTAAASVLGNHPEFDALRRAFAAEPPRKQATRESAGGGKTRGTGTG